MNRFIAKIADYYGLFNMHRNYSKTDQFYYNSDEVKKLHENYYVRPDLPKVDFEKSCTSNNYEFGKLKFPSQVEGDGNEAIFHYAVNTSSEEKINIILVHGWRSTLNKLDKIFKNRLIQNGFNMYSFILPFHMDRTTTGSSYNGEYFITANIVRTLHSFRQAISDIRALIRHIREVKREKVYVIGLSLGGLVSNLVCEHEEVDALASLFYCNDLAFTILNCVPGKYIRKDFINNRFKINQVSDSWKVINPCLRKPMIDKSRIMLISGKYDEYVWIDDTDKLWEAWDRPLRYVYKCGHSGIVLLRKKIETDTMDFFRGLKD